MRYAAPAALLATLMSSHALVAALPWDVELEGVYMKDLPAKVRNFRMSAV